MNSRSLVLTLLLLCLLLAGCNNEAPATNSANTTVETTASESTPAQQAEGEAGPGVTQTDTVAVPPTQEAGRGMVEGRVLAEGTDEPISGTFVRLAEVYRHDEESEANFVLDAAFGPSAITNEEGRFTIYNVRPGEYVIVVGDVEGIDADAYEIIANPDGSGRVVSAVADQTVNIGELLVTLSGIPGAESTP